jgi:8-amino-7-oxononanoate synthase
LKRIAGFKWFYRFAVVGRQYLMPKTLETDDCPSHGYAAGLIYNSGYDANLGLLSSLPQRGDTIITDELVHASIIDGARLSYAERYKFKHNDTNSLEDQAETLLKGTYLRGYRKYLFDGWRYCAAN